MIRLLIKECLLLILILISASFCEDFENRNEDGFIVIDRHKPIFNDNYRISNEVNVHIDWDMDATVKVILPDSVRYGEIYKSRDPYDYCMYDFPFQYESLTNVVWMSTGHSFLRPIIFPKDIGRKYTSYNSKLDAEEIIFIEDGRYNREVNFKKINLLVYIAKVPLEYRWLADTILNNIQIIDNRLNNQLDSCRNNQ